mmetsp:Transcript_72304/g.205627  ORF Transcript_72304/g.205627 Transcript_72304/m.205627 type:complete len:213 (-) Transcript_72304:249-887(-)
MWSARLSDRYFPMAGHLLLSPPPVVTGGLLAEEMGLGKTIIALAAICADNADRPKPVFAVEQGVPNRFTGKIPAPKEVVKEANGGTLVIVPVSLLLQWKKEIETKTKGLSMYIYHGEGSHGQAHVLTRKMVEYDVVLTTFSKVSELTSRGGGGAGSNRSLEKIRWHRLVVDECQLLKNDTAAIARACASLVSTHVWMLSGTPLTNKLDDLQV